MMPPKPVARLLQQWGSIWPYWTAKCGTPSISTVLLFQSLRCQSLVSGMLHDHVYLSTTGNDSLLTNTSWRQSRHQRTSLLEGWTDCLQRCPTGEAASNCQEPTHRSATNCCKIHPTSASNNRGRVKCSTATTIKCLKQQNKRCIV